MRHVDDEGTWRRIRIFNHNSKFVENLSKNPKPNEFLMDNELSEKFETIAGYFISMLIDYHKNNCFNIKNKAIMRPSGFLCAFHPSFILPVVRLSGIPIEVANYF